MPIAKRIQKSFAEPEIVFLIRLGIGILGVLLFSVIVSRIVYPFDTGYLEAFSWMPAEHLLEGKNPYAFALTPPYSMTPYGIVYYALLAVGLKFFGFQLWWGRILSVLGLAVCLWAVVKITKNLTQDKEAVWFACFICLAMFPIQMWVGIMRSDLIAAAFALTAIRLVFELEENEKTNLRIVFLMVLLSAAAFFTKQTFLLSAGIVVLRFLQLKKWREAALFISIFAIVAASGIFLLDQTSAGGYVWQHFTHARELPFSISKVLESLQILLTLPPAIVFGIFLLIFVYRRQFSDKGEKLLTDWRSPKLLILFYFLLSLGWNSLSAGREGAGIYYYLENSFLVAITGGLIYENFRQNAERQLAGAMIVLLILGGTFQLARGVRGEYFRWQALSYYREISDTAAGFTPPGSVCFSRYADLVVRNGCAFHFDDFAEYTSDWSPELHAVFEKEIRSRRYPVIIWETDDFQTKFPGYRLVPMSQSPPERFPPVFLYVREKSPE